MLRRLTCNHVRKKEPEKDTVPTYGLLAINHAYNEGKITFKERLKLSREWAEALIRQYETDEKEIA